MPKFHFKHWLPAICVAVCVLAPPGASLQAAVLAEPPAPKALKNLLVESMLSKPEFEPVMVLMADEFSLESAAPLPICGRCDLNAPAQPAELGIFPLVTDVPEPASLALVGLSLTIVFGLRRRK
ncbi:PEP-CTERM sorting domain-containing protein [Paludibaculum fermentans]|uniref:PEP-CTERM sorting domain-containing protein n=1 Tax=Paludibaculum fermentans TaxID=1473598 RepID=A0A7S7NMR2_PALFE|nr:PEP-CTERM sorting domain-containing protein [Paludibaculum fermentans]QOY86487.1 PEP-CTERM sorting domain-containing protein [Paludibaculum fermentans]